MAELSSRERELKSEKLLETIEKSQFGFDSTLHSPFGTKKVVYADYTASAKPLTFIEDFIRDHVLRCYANTHTTTSVTSRQTTHFREEARLIIRNAVNASESDSVVFAGSGCTGAVHKLIHCLRLGTLPTPPVVFVSPFEHHSNLLPWREIGAEVVWINQNEYGQADILDLEAKLKHHSASGRKLIGALNAASNLTGVLTDANAFSALLHKYSALAFWDFATAAPYVEIDMNPVVISSDRDLVYKDAVYFSMHKFVGGVDSPGILVAKKQLLENHTPHSCGGGTIFFVTASSHRYFKEPEMREEGGTPAIIGSIRAGLAMQLKEAAGREVIAAREMEIANLVFREWKGVDELVVVGPHSVPRLPVFSFLIRHVSTRRFLHHNFVCALLNDLFGIQARGGCSCAGPYAQNLLGLSEDMAKKYEALVMEDNRLDRTHLRRYHEYSEREVLRPGVTRLSFPYFMSPEAIHYIIKAVAMVARHGWKLLPQYQFDPETGLFKHHTDHPDRERVWLSAVSYDNGEMRFSGPAAHTPTTTPTYKAMLEEAQTLFDQLPARQPGKLMGDQSLFLSTDAEEMRWFLLPSEAQESLNGDKTPPTCATPPFEPRVYRKIADDEFGEESEACGRTRADNGSQSEAGAEGEDSGALEGTATEGGAMRAKFHSPPKRIYNPTVEAVEEYGMVRDGDRVLVCLSGGKDSLSLLHTLHQYQFAARAKGVSFTLGAVTVDPQSDSYNPRPLVSYLKALGLPYFYEEQGILAQARSLPECASICSFCSRMKRGRLYACARREGYNVLAMGQHLDDLAESFLMSVFHNGLLRTMKAHYTIEDGDLRVIRPFVYVREKHLRHFAETSRLPVISDNCPACFQAPKERHRVKQLLAAQELLFPRLYHSLQAALKPLMGRGLEGRRRMKSGSTARDSGCDAEKRMGSGEFDSDREGSGNSR